MNKTELMSMTSAAVRRVVHLEGITRPTIKEKNLRANYFMIYTQAKKLHGREDQPDFAEEVERIGAIFDQLEQEFEEVAAQRRQAEPSAPVSNLVVKVPEQGQARLNMSRGGRRPGAGRKKLGETRRVSLTLPPEWWARIDNVRESQNRSQADVIRELLHGAFYEFDYDIERLKQN